MAISIIWYRNDLRMQDHEPFFRAAKAGHELVGVYCIDPRHYRSTSLGFAKTGENRELFLHQSLQDLQQAWKRAGGQLWIIKGMPEIIVPQIARLLQVKAVYAHKEVTAEETAVESALEDSLAQAGIDLNLFWGSTLFHPEDLPFPIKRLPELFTEFRKQVEREVSVRVPFHIPNALYHQGALPEGFDLYAPISSRELRYTGGSRAAHKRIQEYVFDRDRLRIYKETRNGMLEEDDSSKFSPWLALGCVSAREVYTVVKQYEEERVANDSTYWLVFELLWRDYFRFIALKHGDALFKPEGIQGIPIDWIHDEWMFERWRMGNTGFPLIDANMRELQQTGWMSNRGRQNVASFLTKNLGIDWRWGAWWFESQLLDYDVCSNYGNWNYAAGVGNDARGFRYFNIVKQAHDYDPKGAYVRHWLPELSVIPGSKIHEPYKLTVQEQQSYEFQLGKHYPKPIVHLENSVKENQKRYQHSLKRAW